MSNDATWHGDHLGDDAFEYRLGTSVIAEFVLGHTPADVLRELVQNEYDAGGTSVTVEFGADALTVTGNGSVIDAGGWRRLSVMLGTGEVAGAGGAIAAKTNGIGSKNFGLRSLFLFGDRISIASGGRYTVLDRRSGALRTPRRDEATEGRPGVTLRVKYRQQPADGLPAFDEEQERQALTEIARELSPTLIKLADPGSSRSINTVAVRSQRTGADLGWRQRVRAATRGGRGIRRAVRITQRGRWRLDLTDRIEEVEYQRTVLPPAALRRKDLPAYFRRPGGRVLIGVSLPIRRARPDLDAAGGFYYPLGAQRSRTGFPISVNAPFEMNDDRSQIRGTVNSAWNAWLIEQAAAFAVALLAEEWHDAFGADAYRALAAGAAAAATENAFPAAVDRLLRTEPCWATRARTGRSGKPQFARADELVVPAGDALAPFVEQTIKPRAQLAPGVAAHAHSRQAAMACGASSFTVNSLVRMRCAGPDPSTLKTKVLPGEANRYFTNFPDALADLAVQVRFARALDAARPSLADRHRADLRASSTTLTAAGTLRAPDTPLWVLPPGADHAVSPESALHPDLADHKTIARLCQRFDVSAWARSTAERLQSGDADDADRHALLRCVRTGTTLSPAALSAARRAPIVLDQHLAWVAPADTVLRSAAGVSLIEPGVSLLPPDDEANPAFTRLKPRAKLRPEDLIRLAHLVDAGQVPPAVLRRALRRLPRLLTANAAKTIGAIRCLDTTGTTLTAPQDTYVPDSRAAVVLGLDAPVAVDLPPRVLAALGSRSEPTVSDLLDTLRRLRDTAGAAAPDDALYRALPDGARRERRSLTAHRDEPLVHTVDGWQAADTCLLGSEHRSVFLDTVPVLTGPLKDVYRALGAHPHPIAAHWRTLLTAVSTQHGDNHPVPANVGRALVKAYARMAAPPDGLAAATRCLLDRRGTLRPLSDAANKRLLLNDEPALAAAASAAGAGFAFAETTDPQTWRFWRAAGVQSLTSVARRHATAAGHEIPAPRGVQVEPTLARLHQPAFASALAALTTAVLSPATAPTAVALRGRLRRRDTIRIVSFLRREYTLPGGVRVTVSTDHDVQDDAVVLTRPANQLQFRHALARAVATIAHPSGRDHQALTDAVYFLLACASAADMQQELARRGVDWHPEPQVPWTVPDDGHDDDDLDDLDGAATTVRDVADALSAAAVRDAMTARPPRHDPPAKSNGDRRSALADSPPAGPLPDLDTVAPVDVSTAPPAPRGRGHRSGRPGTWTPRTPAEQDSDRELGRRGEQIVLARERRRVAARGRPQSDVVWVADTDPAADHDIRSVDKHGQPIYIEVKSTRGRDGRFSWPAAEFRLAVQQGDRYVLARVYEAHTRTPAVAMIRNPVQALLDGDIEINLESLTGDVGTVRSAPTDTAPSDA